MIPEIVIFVTLILVTSLYFTYKNRVNHFKSFKNRGIPGPEPSLFLGNYSDLNKYRNKNHVFEKWVEQYGEVVGFFLGTKTHILISDPDTINQVFVKNSKLFYNRPDFAIDAKYLVDSVISLKNERWAKLRKLLTPIFSYTKVHSGVFDADIHGCIAEFHKEVVRRINEGNIVDLKEKKSAEMNIHDLTQAFTLDVISRTSFNLKEKVYEPKNHLMNMVREYFQFAGNFLVQIASIIPFFRSFLTFLNNRLTSGRLVSMIVARLKEHINQFLKNHQKNLHSNANDETEENDSKSGQAKVLVSLIKKFADKSITENEFIGNILLILLAGYETTANSLTNACYLLAKHPDIQTKLREEIKKDDIESKYLDMFWYENLRIYPPVTLFVTRETEKDCVINGIQFLKKDVVIAPVWLIHHNETYWPQPFDFRPERFDTEERKNHHPAQFLAFGIGQKACLGLNFANYEAKLLLKDILSKFKLETCKDTPNPLEFIVPTVINNPSKPVVLKITKIDE